jgi:hypothetical protein
MNRRTFVKTLPALTLLAGTGAGLAQESSGSTPELKPISLPKPETDGGKSVLAAWFHNCNRENTAKEFKLGPEQRVLFAQTVGYPA